MMEPLFGKRTRFPSLHPRRRHRYPVDAANTIGNKPTDLFETPTTKKLTSACNMILTLKAVLGRVITAIFREWSSSDTESRILHEFANQKLQIIAIEGKIGVKVADYFVINRAHSFEPRFEGMNFASEIPLDSLLPSKKFDPWGLLGKLNNNLCSIIGRSIVNNNPALWQNGLGDHG